MEAILFCALILKSCDYRQKCFRENAIGCHLFIFFIFLIGLYLNSRYYCMKMLFNPYSLPLIVNQVLIFVSTCTCKGT